MAPKLIDPKECSVELVDGYLHIKVPFVSDPDQIVVADSQNQEDLKRYPPHDEKEIARGTPAATDIHLQINRALHWIDENGNVGVYTHRILASTTILSPDCLSSP